MDAICNYLKLVFSWHLFYRDVDVPIMHDLKWIKSIKPWRNVYALKRKICNPNPWIKHGVSIDMSKDCLVLISNLLWFFGKIFAFFFTFKSKERHFWQHHFWALNIFLKMTEMSLAEIKANEHWLWSGSLGWRSYLILLFGTVGHGSVWFILHH